MDFERVKRKCELAEAETELKKTELGGEALLTELRLILDPLLVDRFTQLDLEKGAVLMTELKTQWDQARRLTDRIFRLNRALGN